MDFGTLNSKQKNLSSQKSNMLMDYLKSQHCQLGKLSSHSAHANCDTDSFFSLLPSNPHSQALPNDEVCRFTKQNKSWIMESQSVFFPSLASVVDCLPNSGVGLQQSLAVRISSTDWTQWQRAKHLPRHP